MAPCCIYMPSEGTVLLGCCDSQSGMVVMLVEVHLDVLRISRDDVILMPAKRKQRVCDVNVAI